MDYLTIDWELLDNVSYQTKLGRSLKNSLRKFDKEELFKELNDIIKSFTRIKHCLPNENRIKSIQSCLLKYDKYYPATPVEKAFNDMLGIRIVVDSYDCLDEIYVPEDVRIVDMRNGKAIDDGYRAIHLYFQKDHFHYPIEIQIMSSKDHQFNVWLHTFLYKYVSDASIGRNLRDLYERGIIITEEDFRKEMKKCVI